MTPRQRFVKRSFDLVVSAFALALLWPLILLAALAARLETGESGFFRQKRVGEGGRIFEVVKIRTMRPVPGVESSVTTRYDVRITPLGRLLRRYKIDELPQLWNVLKGEMSLVGPRPDVPGFADRLEGEDRIVLSLPPGITGPATLKYRREEELLAEQEDPERYNREVIWPDKVRINREYVQHWSLTRDLQILWQTIKGE